MLGQCVLEQEHNQRMSRQDNDPEAPRTLAFWHLNYSVIKVWRLEGISHAFSFFKSF